MAERDRLHIILRGQAEPEPYRRPPRRMEPRAGFVPTDREGHGRLLETSFQQAEEDGQARRAAEALRLEGVLNGIYVRFESFPDVELALESLDPRQGRVHPELRAVREVTVDNRTFEQAVVFVPDGTLGYFLRRVEKYLATAENENPRNYKLLDRIQSIGLASLEELWTDPDVEFPTGTDPVWWEVWLRRRDGHEIDRLRQFAEATGAQLGRQTLGFSDRLVVLVRASRTQLARAIDVLDDVAELRRPQEPAGLLALEQAFDQAQWVEQLAGRTTPARPDAPAACIVDTGVHQAHPLLEPSLLLDDCHTCDPTWGVGDENGHGTEMAGIALYGDLGEAVLSGGAIRLRHGLESVKIMRQPGTNPPRLWGALTATATSAVEIQAPQRKRAFGMAVSAVRDPAADSPAEQIRLGQPTSWSASVDALASGLAIEMTEDGMVFLDEEGDRERRLFLLAAGNVGPEARQDDFLDRSDVEPIEDPGQAWNALTVGAYTDAVNFDDHEDGYEGWTALAPRGELSPHSRTSVPFHRQWPIKPDVVFEGGNLGRSPEGRFDTPYALQALTTKAPIRDARLLTVTCATSAATALASHFAVSILADYPALWPETVRGLILHSAEWTPAMQAHFDAENLRQRRVTLQRRYGMGVPDLGRATRSATDALTLIAEDVIHPFDGDGHMREMTLHDLPWPTEVLAELGGIEVRLRVTLSYFVDPNPSRRGWQRRYAYPSHGLRFDVRRPTETNDIFRQRINERARLEEERRPLPGGDDPGWFFGPNQRVVGSIHTDIWTGTAADLAHRGALAVFPVSGWWKERPQRDRSEQGARYSLIVSIETPGQEVDIWTPVAAEIGVPIVIET